MKISRAQLMPLISFLISSLISMSIFCSVGKYLEYQEYQRENQRIEQENQRIKRENRLIEAHKKPDSRMRVQRPLDGPYQAIVQLTLDKGEKKNCTGFVVAPKAVLTNRHCLEDAKSVLVEIGENDGDGLAIYKSMESTRFQVSASGLDYGVIFLPDPLTTAHFSLQEFPENADLATMVTAGYPGDKDYFTMWENKYHCFAFLGKSEVISGGVAAGGQSGSPLFQIKGGRFAAMGIHYASSACEGGNCPLETTFFVPFSDWVLLEIRLWIAMNE